MYICQILEDIPSPFLLANRDWYYTIVDTIGDLWSGICVQQADLTSTHSHRPARQLCRIVTQSVGVIAQHIPV